MQVPVNYRSWKGREWKECALVDSRATENFLDFRMVTRWRLGTQQLEMPRQVFNVDGTENQLGQVTKYCTLRITCGDMDQLQMFYVTNLGTDRVILRLEKWDTCVSKFSYLSQNTVVPNHFSSRTTSPLSEKPSSMRTGFKRFIKVRIGSKMGNWRRRTTRKH